MTKELTLKDIMDCCHMKDGIEQQIFLLSRFFKIDIDTLRNMPFHEINPMMGEMNEYFDNMDSNSGFKLKEVVPDPDPKSPNVVIPVKNRSHILDFSKWE